jgi:hypothetical protein
MQRTLFFIAATLVFTAGMAFPAGRTEASIQARAALDRGAAAGTVSKQIDTYLKGLTARNQLSGAVLVARKGKILLARGYGMAVRESGILNSPTTKTPSPVPASLSPLGSDCAWRSRESSGIPTSSAPTSPPVRRAGTP